MRVSKPVLFVFIFAIGVSLYLFFSDKPKKVSAPKEVPSQPVTLPPASKPQTQSLQRSNEFARWARDPFLLPENVIKKEAQEKKGHEVPSLRLHAIIEGKRGRVAILGDEVVTKGDIIKSGEKVVEINKESLTLMSKDSKRVIFLEKQ